MEYKMIQAPNMKVAMLKIHQELGPNAIMYRTRKTIGGIEVLAGLPKQEQEQAKNHAYTFNSDEHETVKHISGDLHMQEQLQELSRKVEMLTTSINRPDRLPKLIFRVVKGWLSSGILKIVNMFGRSHHKMMQLSYVTAKSKVLEIVSLLKNAGVKGNFHLSRGQYKAVNSREIKALVGPSGVGKTTTIIKLATQFSTKYELSDIGIIITNSEDIYIKNNLCLYCEIHNIDYVQVYTPEELSLAIDKMAEKRLILIDTHGVSQRDVIAMNKLRNVIEKTTQPIQLYITLAASHQPEVIEDCIRYYRFKNIAGCILTRADEAIRLEPALGAIVRCNLPIAYVTNGQDLDGDIYTINQIYDADLYDLEIYSRMRMQDINLDSINWI